jgi:hypothetical protein
MMATLTKNLQNSQLLPDSRKIQRLESARLVEWISLPGAWLRRSAERRRLRREVGYDRTRIERLELDIGVPSDTLKAEMEKFFWQV